jgi:hypothetical protein
MKELPTEPHSTHERKWAEELVKQESCCIFAALMADNFIHIPYTHRKISMLQSPNPFTDVSIYKNRLI